MIDNNNETKRLLYTNIQEVQPNPEKKQLSEGIDNPELQLQDTLPAKSMLKSSFVIGNTFNDVDFKTVIANHILGSKLFGKLKRLDPTKKVVDAFDIDWTGYDVNWFNTGTHLYPTTTYEMLDVIFRMLQFLYDKYMVFGEEDVVWNDSGAQRSYEHRLDWMSIQRTGLEKDFYTLFRELIKSTLVGYSDEDILTMDEFRNLISEYRNISNSDHYWNEGYQITNGYNDWFEHE